VLGKPIQEILTKLDSRWEKMLQNCLAGRRDESLVYLNEDSEYGTTWFEMTCVPWYDENENIVGLIIEAEDITQKTLLEDEYNKLRSLLKTTSEIGKIGYWEYCFTTNKLSWCSMTRKIHEVSESFVPEMDSAVQFYKDGHSKNTISMAIHQAMTHGTGWSERLKIFTAKGNEIWVQASGMPIYEGDKLIGLTGTFQNIDEQVRSEIKITESEIRMRTLIDNLPLNVFIKDIESRKILVNKAECEFLGVKNSEELIGKTNFDVFEPELAQKLTNQDLKVMETLTPLLSHENTIQKKNGEIVTFLTSKIPLLDDNGKSNGLIGISMNISDFKQKEEELRNLVHVTSLQNKKLVNFAHIVSHNLRSHTANFSMLLDFLNNEQDESEKENIMGMLTDASDNLLETLENLNEVVNINTNVNVDKKSILLKRKIDNTIQNLSAYLKTNKANIINQVSKTQKVKVIPAYIDTILMNFITNAVKYKNPKRDAIITFSTSIEENYTVLSITDNGLGIDLKKYGHKIFGMYKTFHNHDDARGIGLYIAKNQIEAMNGKISVYSTVGVGTTFKIYFNEKN
ncbi:hypothetical protein LCGC14_1111970, partial [marine sediment metagenome]